MEIREVEAIKNHVDWILKLRNRSENPCQADDCLSCNFSVDDNCAFMFLESLQHNLWYVRSPYYWRRKYDAMINADDHTKSLF